MYNTFGREITKHAVIYGAYRRFWLTIEMMEKVMQKDGTTPRIENNKLFDHASRITPMASRVACRAACVCVCVCVFVCVRVCL
jgi:hypothetical protein